jgi:glycerol-3-phosphate responsive antiterminator
MHEKITSEILQIFTELKELAKREKVFIDIGLCPYEGNYHDRVTIHYRNAVINQQRSFTTKTKEIICASEVDFKIICAPEYNEVMKEVV